MANIQLSANDVIKKAVSLGACSKSGSVTDWKSLCWLFFSPQGREFCESNNFPSLSTFQEMKPFVEKWGVFVDSGNIEKKDVPYVGIIGNTTANLMYEDNTKVHKVIIMHGAKANIKITGYAVVLLVNIGNCEVNIEKSETAKIL